MPIERSFNSSKSDKLPLFDKYFDKFYDLQKLAFEINKYHNSKSKYLVVYTNSKNTAAKTEFDAFVKDQETQTGYNMYDKYNALYDVYNYYLAGTDEKKWLKSNGC